jgi:thymidine phosphorylase
MSKKIAEGTGALVLDVKVGSGAFMKSVDDARELARTMVELGGASGVRTVALLTDMSTPLGLAVGHAVEVTEAVEVLAGGGPADVVELTVAIARVMLALAGQPDADVEAALAALPTEADEVEEEEEEEEADDTEEDDEPEGAD